jgi:hypothetical protein
MVGEVVDVRSPVPTGITGTTGITAATKPRLLRSMGSTTTPEGELPDEVAHHRPEVRP